MEYRRAVIYRPTDDEMRESPRTVDVVLQVDYHASDGRRLTVTTVSLDEWLAFVGKKVVDVDYVPEPFANPQEIDPHAA